MVKMDEFLATKMFFLGPDFAKNRPEVKKFAFWRNFASKKNADTIYCRGSSNFPSTNILGSTLDQVHNKSIALYEKLWRLR
jgi:hypothetical protein